MNGLMASWAASTADRESSELLSFGILGSERCDVREELGNEEDLKLAVSNRKRTMD